MEEVTISLEGFKKSPLRLSFREEDNLLFKKHLEQEKWCVGYPEAGVIWRYQSNTDEKQPTGILYINLNRPAVIAALLLYFSQNGWLPKEAKRPFVIDDALRFLDIIAWPQDNNSASTT